MPDPQPGIFHPDTTHHHLLEYRLSEGTTSAALRQALQGLHAPLPFDDPAGGPACVVAFGPAGLTALGLDVALSPFPDLAGPKASMPSTQRDVFVWVHGQSAGPVHDRARLLHEGLAEVASLELEERGFVYHDSRDLSGFVDGSGNPKGDKARAAALLADGPLAGGSYVLSQRWVHDLAAFEAHSIEEQERMIGRTKSDSIEFEGDRMPDDAHVARTDVSEAKIFRRSMPIGGVAEHGLYFLAFGCDTERFDLLLRRMLGLTEDGITDRLFEFTRPTTGSLWFAPPAEKLA